MYKRVLLKLSGEALAGAGTNLNPQTLKALAEELKQIHDLDVELAIVVGGGNFIRGKFSEQMGLDRAQADYMGMLATVINALAVQNALEKEGVPTRVQSAIEMNKVAEPYILRRAIRHLEKKRVVIFGAGTGNPYFSTDTTAALRARIEMNKVAEPYILRRAIRHLEKKRVVIFGAGTGNPYFSTDTTAALRASEIKADVILMAKNGVDGVYSADPKVDPNATRYDSLTYMDLIQQGLTVMDTTATSMCMDNDIDLLVFNMNEPGNILKAVKGEVNGTVITKGR